MRRRAGQAHGGKCGPGCQPGMRPSDVVLNFSPLRNVVPTGRCLPHWEQEGRTYFVRYCTARGLQLPPRARDVVIENLRHWHGHRYVLHQAVVMPDHVHLLITPLAKQEEGPQAGSLCHTVAGSRGNRGEDSEARPA